MQMPNVVTTVKDTTSDVTYQVKAYRQLNRQEMLQAIGMYLRQSKKKPKRGMTVTIVSLIGLNE